MGFITDTTVEKVKNAIDIVSLVGSYVDLKRTGKNFRGCCPFHHEKTPSFFVSPERGTYNCFGCHEHGDGIGFIMKMENMTFSEAIRFLAEKYGVMVEEKEEDSYKKERFNTLYEINKKTMMFYYKNLLTSAVPQKYLKNRGMKPESINTYFLGYADGKGDSLYQYLSSLGYSDEDLIHLGLISKSNRGTGYYDRFRNRLIFPIISHRDKIIGFGGRIIGDGNPKYLNSPESDIFYKGENLYGLHVVKKSPNHKKMLMVEGYMDVISLQQYGIDYAAASLGTALTEQQARLIKRYADDIYLCYDGDSAGIKAAKRAIEIFEKEDVVPKMMLLPGGQDPDDFCKKYGKEGFESEMDKAVDPIDFELNVLRAGYVFGSEITDVSEEEKDKQRLEFLRKATDYLAHIKEKAVRTVYVQKVAKMVSVDEESLQSDVISREDKIRTEEERSGFNKGFGGGFSGEFNNEYGDNEMSADESFYYPEEDSYEEGSYNGSYYSGDAGYYTGYGGAENVQDQVVEKKTGLFGERTDLEYELLYFYQKNDNLRSYIYENGYDFIEDDEIINLFNIIKSLSNKNIPVVKDLLMQQNISNRARQIVDKLENDEKRYSFAKDKAKENIKELFGKIEIFKLREERNKLYNKIRAKDFEEMNLGEMMNRIKEIDAKLKAGRR